MRRALLVLVAIVALSSACVQPRRTLSGSGTDLPGSVQGEPLAADALQRFRPAVVLPTPPLILEAVEGVPLAALSGREAALEDVLLSIFAGSELNILVGDDVRRTLSFDVKGTTMEGAFTSLLGHLDLAWRLQGDYVVVERQEQRAFALELPTVATDDELSTLDAQDRLWDELTAELAGLLGSRGQVVSRPASGTLEVVAPPSLMALVADQIDAFQRTLVSPVRLSARLVEVHTPQRGTSLDWEAVSAALGIDGPRHDGALDLGFASVDELLAALSAQGDVTLLSAVRATTRNGSPARLALPLGPDGDLAVRVLPRSATDGSIDLSVERPVTGADGVTRVGAARASVSAGRALVLTGPRHDLEGRSGHTLFGGIFAGRDPLASSVHTLLVLEPLVTDLGLAASGAEPGAHPAERLLDRPAQAGLLGKRTSVTRAGLAAALHTAGCQALVAGHDRQALGLFQRVTELDPLRLDAWLHASALQLRTGRALEAARLADRALALGGDDLLALSLRGLADLADDNPGAALPFLRRAYSLRPCAVTSTNLAAALIAGDRLDEARLILSEHHADEAELYQPHLDRAFLHLVTNELTAARTELLAAATLGAPAGGERMVQLQYMAHRLDATLGADDDRPALSDAIQALVDPNSAPDHFLSGWH